MNSVIKLIIDKAIDYPADIEKKTAALDEIYAKLVVIPLQRVWRSKSPSEKRRISDNIQSNLYTECFDCKSSSKCSGFLTCNECHLEERYRYRGASYDY